MSRDIKKWQIDKLRTSGKIYIVGLMKAGKSTFLNGVIKYLLKEELREVSLAKNYNEFSLFLSRPLEATLFNTEIAFTPEKKVNVIIQKEKFTPYGWKEQEEKEKLIYDIEKIEEVAKLLKDKMEMPVELEKEDDEGIKEISDSLGRYKTHANEMIIFNEQTKHAGPGLSFEEIRTKLRKENYKAATKKITKIVLKLPINFLKKNQLVLVDTPGFDSGTDTDTDTDTDRLKRLKKEDKQRIKEIVTDASKLIWILDADTIQRGSFDDLLTNIKETFSNEANGSVIPMEIIVNYRATDNPEDVYRVIKSTYEEKDLMREFFKKIYIVKIQETFNYENVNKGISNAIEARGRFYIFKENSFLSKIDYVLTPPEQKYPELLKNILDFNIENTEYDKKIQPIREAIKSSFDSLNRNLNKNAHFGKGGALMDNSTIEEITSYMNERTKENIEEYLFNEKRDLVFIGEIEEKLKESISEYKNEDLTNDILKVLELLKISSSTLLRNKIENLKQEIKNEMQNFLDNKKKIPNDDTKLHEKYKEITEEKFKFLMSEIKGIEELFSKDFIEFLKKILFSYELNNFVKKKITEEKINDE